MSVEEESSELTVSLDTGNLTCYDESDIVDDGTNFEEILRSAGAENAQLIMQAVFDLPKDPPQAGIPGVVVQLPKPATHLPREKPLPKPKTLTKWEKFAKEKGIQKRKKSRMVYDEDKEQYMPRWGYKKANDEGTAWAVPAKAGEDVTVDPWTRMENEKKERMVKNKKQQINNLKDQLKETQGKDRVPGAIDLAAVAATVAGPQGRKASNRKEKHHVQVALALAQKSTASMGQFDSVKKREPKPKMAPAPKNHDVEISVAAEKKQSLAVLERMMGGGKDIAPEAAAARVVHKEVMQQGVSKGDKKGKGKRRRPGADGIADDYVMDTGKKTGSRASSAKAQKKAGDYGGKHGQGKGKKGSSMKHKQ